jgi:hypothetical protein
LAVVNFDPVRASRVYSQLGGLADRWSEVSAVPGEPPAWLDLTPYEHQVFSQNGEDGVICEIFRRIGVASGSFVEFGVDTGQEGNCVFLADVLGWRGLFMDAYPPFFRRLQAKYAPSRTVATRNVLVDEDNIDDLLLAAALPPELDIISIDIDGADFWVWRGLTAYRPRVVVVEYNSLIDQNLPLVQPKAYSRGWDGSDFFGSSMAAFVALGEEKGYRLVHCELAGVNLFFVRDDLSGDFPAPGEVRRRGPNYFLSAQGHPPNSEDVRYVRYGGESGADCNRPSVRHPRP